jgi:acyl-CoA thioester hydrolase
MLLEDLKNMLLDFKDQCRVKVRFNDTDMMGIVHFKNYLVYFDDGFVNFMNNFLSSTRIEDTVHEGVAFGIKKVEITYEGTARFGDYVIVETRLSKIGTSSITFQHDIFREKDKTLLAKVECVRLAMDVNTHELVDVLTFFLKYQ